MSHNSAAPRLGATLVTILAVGLGLVVHDASAKQRALLIGINDYLANDAGQTATGGWVPQDLNGALNDVALMRSVLERRYGFPSESITILENEAATREAMLENLARIIADSGPGDTVYIHFSGHGSQVEDRNGDETDGLDESILPYDARTGDVPDITDDELGALLAGLKTDRAWIVLDSCHSGTATRGAGQVLTRSVPLDPRGDLYEAQPGPGAGSLEAPYVLMTGAAEYQSALDGPIDEGRHYGLFTLSMGRVMGQADAAIPARDLHHRVREEMARIGGQFGLYAIPEAQLEGPEDRLSAPVLQPVSGRTGVAVSGSGDEVRLEETE